MQSSNRHRFRISPPWAGEEFLDVEIPLDRIAPAQKKKERPTSFLLIGFDTEYQTIDAVDRDAIHAGEARNEVISYQYCVSAVHRDLSKATTEASGIILPNEGERLPFADFIASAIGAYAQKFPDEVLPLNVYLIGHFIRADLPAFEDFAFTAKQLSAVRNTFVSVDSKVSIDLFGDEGGSGSFSVQLRDTILLAPANAKSLADIGEIVGLPKITLADDPNKDVRIKENMKQFSIENWDVFRDYAIRDAEVCVRYAEKVMRQFDTLFETFQLPITLTQFGTKKVLQDWAERGWNPLTILGREEIETKKFVKKLGYSRTETKRPYQSKVHHNLSLATDTYHGGRNEQFAFGICDEGEWRDHDLSSAYTTAMSLIGTPNWETLRSFDNADDLSITDLAYAVVDFEFPDTVRFPTLPIRTANGILFPRKGRSECSAPEIVLAKKLGAKLTIYEGARVDADKSVPIFKNFIVECIGERSKHPKGSFENLFWKEVGNSTYGKTAQGLKNKRVYDHRDDEMVVLPESKITQPYFASFITSYVRAVLGEVLNAFPPEVQVFSVTTDGFLSDASEEQILAATSGELFTSFSDARKALDVDSAPLEVKHQVRQPIGWRTRGSATLKCGSSADSNIVLQKGGIKTNRFFNTEQDNSYVVELFFNRYPEQKIHYTSGIGLKDMVRYEADFVSRSVTKRLSMEFDWKRRPVAPTDRAVEFNGTTYTHLSFETEPLADDTEFRNIRGAWDKYDDKPRKNLKCLTDYEEFRRFLETQKLSKDSKRYLRKKDGAISRLRRDLTRAFKGREAGFDKVDERLGKISHQYFIEALASCGIPCKVSDLDNAKRQTFKPHQSVREPETIRAISLLKELHFNEIDIECFFE